MSSPPASASTAPGSSYGQIFKSTAFTGGGTLVTLGLGILRTKILAVLLGPSGVGLGGVYTTIVGVASTLAGMGISSSGVRQIAEASGSGDEQKIARAVCTLRRTSWILGLGGALLLAALSRPVSSLTFGDHAHAGVIAALGLAVFFGAVSGGQIALIQGLRRIADLTLLNVLGAVAGTALGIPIIWWLGLAGVGPMFIVVSFAAVLFSWWFARRVPTPQVSMSWRETFHHARSLLGLGFSFMASGLMVAAVAYLIRLLVVRHLGIESAGHYTAAYTLSAIYAGFILQAMGTDFYPRLTSVSTDHRTMNRLVNEQTEIALLMAVPGVLATLVFAPWVIHAFYAGNFDPAAEVLQWQVLGILCRVISWPMGFILLAKDLRALFLATELGANALHVAFLWQAVRAFGLAGAGMAFAGMYLCYALLMVVLCRRVTGFQWSPVNVELLRWMLPLVTLVFLVRGTVPEPWGFAIAALTTVLTAAGCLRALLRRAPSRHLSRLRLLLNWP